MSEAVFRYGQPMPEDGKKGPPKPTPARFALAANLKDLMGRYNKGFGTGISPTELEQGCGVSAKTVRRVLDPYNDISPNLETIDLLATFFRLDTWEMIRPRASGVAGREKQTPHKPEDSSRSALRREKAHDKEKIQKS